MVNCYIVAMKRAHKDLIAWIHYNVDILSRKHNNVICYHCVCVRVYMCPYLHGYVRACVRASVRACVRARV